MAARNISATVNIGASMASSVGAVFGGLKKRIDNLGGSLGKLKKQSAEIVKLQTAQGKLADAKAKGNAAAVKRYSGEVDKLTKSLTEAGVDTKNLAQEQTRLAAAIGKSEQQLARMTRTGASLDRLKTSAQGVGSAFGTMRDRMGAAFTRLGVAAGVIGAATAGVAYLTTEFIDQGDALADQAEGLNMSTEALQTWQFAAGTVGVESDRLAATFAKLQAKIAEGSDKTQETFKKLGINFSRLRKLSPDAQLSVIAEAFSKLPEKVNKTALATEIFGKSGFKLVPILNQGQKGLEALNAEARRTGYILGDETNAAVGDADAAFNRFKLSLAGFRNRALAPLLPVFTNLIGQLGAIIEQHGPALVTWIESAGKAFMQDAAPAIGAFVRDTLPGLVQGLGQVIGTVGTVLNSVQGMIGGWGNLGLVLLGLNFAPVLASLASLGKALWALGAAMWAALGPWSLLIAAVVGGAILVWKYWEPLKEYFKDFWNGIVFVADAAWKHLMEGVREMRDAFLGVWESIKAGVGSVVDWISAKIQVLLDAFSGLGSWMRTFSGAKVDPSILPNTPANDAYGIPGGAGLMPADRMPAASGGQVTNNVEVKIDARGADASEVERRLRSSLQSRPLYDSTGVLAPQ